MRILMFGRGVISTAYGYVLQAAGHDVEFYVRPARAAAYGDSVQISLIDGRRSPFGRRIDATPPLRLHESLDAAEAFDLVIISVGHHRLTEAATAPTMGRNVRSASFEGRRFTTSSQTARSAC